MVNFDTMTYLEWHFVYINDVFGVYNNTRGGFMIPIS